MATQKASRRRRARRRGRPRSGRRVERRLVLQAAPGVALALTACGGEEDPQQEAQQDPRQIIWIGHL